MRDYKYEKMGRSEKETFKLLEKVKVFFEGQTVDKVYH